MFRPLIVAAALMAALPSLAEPSPMAASPESSDFPSRSAGRLGAIALQYEGATAARFGFRGPWCGFFVEHVRRKAGLSLSGSGRAIDQARAGRRVSAPVPDALMITGRRGGAHVDIVLQRHDDGTVTVIGGNVSKRVTKRRIAAGGIYVIPM